jgi:hypothetical protein
VQVFVVFGGFLVNWAYEIISGYLPEVTKRKVNFVAGSPAEMRERMSKLLTSLIAVELFVSAEFFLMILQVGSLILPCCRRSMEEIVKLTST